MGEIRRRWWTWAVVFYITTGIMTFGHTAAAPEWVGATCYSHGSKHPCDDGDRVFAGFFAGLAWPLYWSWELQS